MRTRIVLFDLDGTLADDRQRHHHLEGVEDWEAYHSACVDDVAVEAVVVLLRLLRKSDVDQVHILTGRFEQYRDITVEWLGRQGITFDRLHMRPDGDKRKNAEYKRSAIEGLTTQGFDPLLLVDDHPGVARAFQGFLPVVNVRGFRDWSGDPTPTQG
jgi:phosphoglycolate phosphatase-like HAD superfamily hydrolase